MFQHVRHQFVDDQPTRHRAVHVELHAMKTALHSSVGVSLLDLSAPPDMPPNCELIDLHLIQCFCPVSPTKTEVSHDGASDACDRANDACDGPNIVGPVCLGCC
jgi:hypothetical protein